MSCHNCKRWKREHDLAMVELKKYLDMNPPETLLGGIRNLAQAFVAWRELAHDLQTEVRDLNETVERLERVTRA